MCLWAITTMIMSIGNSNAKFPKYEDVYKSNGAKSKSKDYTPQDVIDMFKGKGRLIK